MNINHLRVMCGQEAENIPDLSKSQRAWHRGSAKGNIVRAKIAIKNALIYGELCFVERKNLRKILDLLDTTLSNYDGHGEKLGFKPKTFNIKDRI